MPDFISARRRRRASTLYLARNLKIWCMRRWNIRFFLSPSSLPTFHFTFTFYFIPRHHFFLPTFFPSRQDKEKRYWTFRFRWRQLYFYSIRFIRLNMTCGYRLGNIFSILRVDIPTSSPASLLYSLHVSLLPARLPVRHPLW